MAVAESLGVGGDKQLNHQGWEDVAGGGEMRWGSAMMGGAGERRPQATVADRGWTLGGNTACCSRSNAKCEESSFHQQLKEIRV
jgi:hypothetical protein